MMLPLLSLLIFFFSEAAQECCKPCGVSDSAVPPILATDTVNALPPGQVSQRLRRLFSAAKHASKLPIRFAERPNVDSSGVIAAPAEKVVVVRSDFDHAAMEVAIGHELMHLVLQGRGFAAMVHTPGRPGDLMQQLGSTITSCVDDALIDQDLSKLGFRPEILNHDTVQQLKTHPPSFASNAFDDPIMRDGNALVIVCFGFRKRYRGDEIDSYWRQQPTVLARAAELRAKIGDVRCSNADTCLAKKKQIRETLGYPITFCNPHTGEFE